MWAAQCDYGSPPCGRSRRVVIEAGHPRCKAHTKKALGNAEPEVIPLTKAEEAAKAEALALRYWASVERARKRRKESHIVVSGRVRPWDICQLCRRPTASGAKERNPEDRYCSKHHPNSVALFQADMRAGKAAKALCVSNLARFKGCRKALKEGVWFAVKPLAQCQNTSLRCFDPGRKWEVSRAGCATKPLTRKLKAKEYSATFDAHPGLKAAHEARQDQLANRVRCGHCNEVIPLPGRGLKVCRAQDPRATCTPVVLTEAHGESSTRSLPRPVGDAWEQHAVLRAEVVALRARKKGIPAIATLLQLSPRSVYRFLKEARDRAAKPRGARASP